ncbi:MAG: MBL fold metallo-hydrolase [Planctomycetes bacterium]|nr:MBL fold metallo-hydrolase [Planctomycetota bacterium]
MRRELWTVLGNGQRLDGGAMFGNAPKSLWSRWCDADEHNRIELACRCLLVREFDDVAGTERRILLETGIGAFFSPELRQRFGVTSDRHLLVERLERLGFPPSSIDVVVLSHLHFDHAGGLLTSFEEGRDPELVFDAATFVVGTEAFERAVRPHARDRASYIEPLPGLLESSGRLELVDTTVADPRSDVLGQDWSFCVSNGHTPGMLLSRLATAFGPILFAADLIPGLPWVRGSITMGYDRYPELLIDEKKRILSELHDAGGRIVFTHDPHCAMSALTLDDHGRIVATDTAPELEGLAA